jgi:hypothetical protein
MAQAGDYWGASYRLGLDWLDEHAAPGAALAVPLVEHAVRLVAPERLRSDLELLSLPASSTPRARAQALAFLRAEARRRDVYVMFVPREDWMNGLMRHFLSRRRPIRTWDLDGVPVLLMYRLAHAQRATSRREGTSAQHEQLELAVGQSLDRPFVELHRHGVGALARNDQVADALLVEDAAQPGRGAPVPHEAAELEGALSEVRREEPVTHPDPMRGEGRQHVPDAG